MDEKSDVYSFGVVLLELVTGQKPTSVTAFGKGIDLVMVAAEAVLEVEMKAIVDPSLNPSSQEYEAIFRTLNVAILCTSMWPARRPSMRIVVDLLCGRDTAKRLG